MSTTTPSEDVLRVRRAIGRVEQRIRELANMLHDCPEAFDARLFERMAIAHDRLDGWSAFGKRISDDDFEQFLKEVNR